MISIFALNENAYALQYSVPTNVSAGGWASGTFTEIDESVRDDSDFITSIELGKNGNDEVEFGLGPLSDPQVNSDHILNYVYKDDDMGANIPFLTVTLRQGTTDIASWTHTSISSSFVLAYQTLSSAQADSITNYSDLRISFNAQCDAACSNAGPSRNSISVSWAEFSAPDASATVPNTPTNLTATSVSTTQINLSWTAPNDGGSAITGYLIERESPIGGGWSTLVSNTGNTNIAYSDSGLDYSTTYNYRVSAINTIGTGSASDAASATTQSAAPTVPDQVTGLSATVVSTSQINLSWTAPNDGGSTITGYQIEQKDGPWSTIVPNTGNTLTAYSVTGLAADTTYQYRVSAINTIGTGSASDAASATTLATATVPDAPTNLTAISGNQQVTLTWDAPPNDGGSAIIDYIIQVSSNNGFSWIIFDDGVGIQTQTTVTDLQNNLTYLFKVSASNSIGEGTSSQIYAIPTGSTGSSKESSSPELMGMGFYIIDIFDVSDHSSKILSGLKLDNDGTFVDFIPYNTYSDELDVKNFGGFENYEKHGQYIFLDDFDIVPTFTGEIDQPIQLQIRLEDDYASSKIEHVGFYTSSKGNHPSSSELQIIWDKGQPLDVIDENNLLKDVRFNTSIEDGKFWAIIDLVFDKELEKSNIIIETWDEGRRAQIEIMNDSFEIIPFIDNSQKDFVSLSVDVDITHDTSNPTCKVSRSCFTPNNAEILEGGIVSWTNTDTLFHDVESGTPGNPDNRFDLHLLPGETIQKKFDYSGVYKYYCSLHPWATGSVTVISKENPVEITRDEKKSPLLIASETSSGSILIENQGSLIVPNQDLDVEISGHIQEGKGSQPIKIVITKPDGSSEIIKTTTNRNGYYFVPTLLDKKWLGGEYEVVAFYKNKEIASLEFRVAGSEDVQFGGKLPDTIDVLRNKINDYCEDDLSLTEFENWLEGRIDSKTSKCILDKLDFFKN